MANSWQQCNEDPRAYPYQQSRHGGCDPGMLDEPVYDPSDCPNPPPEPSFPKEIEDNPPLKNLLKCMLAYDDKDRPVISSVLDHPFFLSLGDRIQKLRNLDEKLESPPTDSRNDEGFFKEIICRMRTTVPFVATEYLEVDTFLQGNNTMDKSMTTMKYRNYLSKDIPTIFYQTPLGSQHSMEYFHVRTEKNIHNKPISLCDYEEHGPLLTTVDNQFYKRFHAVVRLSRNILEHLKDKDEKIKKTYANVIQLKAGWEENDFPRNFVFLHRGLNWILPALWEMMYKTRQNKEIETDKVDQLQLY